MGRPSTSVLNSTHTQQYDSAPGRLSDTLPASVSPLDDEIDLLELIRAVLRAWKVWLLTILFVTAVYGSYQLVGYLAAHDALPHSKIITLTFKGVDSGQYPSGSTFQIQDIISPAVVQVSYEAEKLQESGLSAVEFQNRISIEPYTPFYREVMERFGVLLANEDLSADQLLALQNQKSRELNQALNSSAILEFDTSNLDLQPLKIERVLQAIPREWARQAIADKGVLKADIQLVSAKTLDDNLFKGVDYVVLSDLFANKIDSLRTNIEKVKMLNGTATVTDPETGWSLSDLENNLHDLEIYTIDELMSPIRSLGLSRNPRLAAFYYEEKQQVLEEKLVLLEEESQLIKSAYDAYGPDKPIELTKGGGPQVSGFTGYSAGSPLGGEMIDKLLQVAGEDSVEKYRQLLNDRWLETNMELAQSKSDLRSTQRLISAVKGQSSEGVTSELRDEYLQRAEKTLPVILERLRNYFNINWRIYEQISRDRVGSVGYLYKDAHQGVLRAGSGVDLKQVILMYIALIALTTFIVVPVAMIRNAMKDRNRRETAELASD